jgi:hypothetical protein
MILVAMLSHHLSSAPVVTLIILQVCALISTLDICPVLGTVIISNCLPAFVWVVLSVPSPAEVVVTSLGIHIIVFCSLPLLKIW